MARGKYQEWLEPDNLLRLQAWARDGLTDEQLAHNMGITARTLYVWKDKYTQISQALKKGKEVVDIQVENALLKRALGYSYNEVVRELVLDKETGKHKLEITKTIKKEVVPDTTAQIFWLKNRKPNEWRDRKETEISGGLNVNNPFAELTTDELRKLARSDKH
uniref:helix-turn-helix domain-containing protein n=1 Tax=Jeotgalibaca porci TaxID=1868793 RepID=UPI0035A01B42